MSEFNIDTEEKIQSNSINNIPQSKLDSKENGKLKKDVNFKENIKFTYSSFKRRNVDKALVRALSSIRKEVKTEILEEYKINHIDKMSYNEIAITLDKINDGGNKRGRERREKKRKGKEKALIKRKVTEGLKASLLKRLRC